MPKKGENVKFKNYEFQINNLCRFQNPEDPCTNKHKKHIACSVFFHNKFSRPFKTQLGKDYVYNFINSMMK